jgi:hypothetical protein
METNDDDILRDKNVPLAALLHRAERQGVVEAKDCVGQAALPDALAQ